MSEHLDLSRCPTCGVPWAPSLDDVVHLVCMEPEPHPGRKHWHRSERTAGQLLQWGSGSA